MKLSDINLPCFVAEGKEDVKSPQIQQLMKGLP